MPIDLILGTAGHIDHGKSSLIRALTGVDTDRLPEEKRRGITIELGFAELNLGDYRLGVVDVPGHERFVRNMLAGATGMDLALLVVAADDSIKPQTREHLEILRLLDLPAGVIALTKVDLVEPGWLVLVEEEIRAFVQGTFLERAPIVRTSAPSGAGLAELREALSLAAQAAAAARSGKSERAPFRLAIDRTFTVAGHGTVVTGSVSSGQAAMGDLLRIEPGGFDVRVRGLHNHDRPVDRVERGQRAAINLAGVHHDEIGLGQELATPGYSLPSKLLTVELSLLATSPRPLKSRDRLRVHLGTAEILASVSLLDRERLKPGDSAPVQLFLNEPAVATWNQPFVVRTESPVITIGGGHVLDPTAEKLSRSRLPGGAKPARENQSGSASATTDFSLSPVLRGEGRGEGPGLRPDLSTSDEQQLDMLAALRSSEPLERASAALYFAALRDWTPSDLVRTAGINSPTEVAAALKARGDLVEIPASPTRVIRVHRLVLGRLGERIAAALLKLHQREPLRTQFDRQQLAAGFAYLEPALLSAALDALQTSGRIRMRGTGVALVGQGPQLSQAEERLLAQLIEQFRQAGLGPPFVKECQAQATRNKESVPQLLALAAAQGEFVEISSDYYLHAEVERQIRHTLAERLTGHSGATLSEIREWLGTTRKYAVPLCEYLDRTGFTRRAGDLRVLANPLDGLCPPQNENTSFL